jgi:uncharacterized delta-60 repeat protein
LLSAGDLDPSFGTNGKVTTDFAGSSIDGATALAVQPDGKIVAVGSSLVPGGLSHFAVARYNGDGSLDPMFGTSGKVTTDIDQQNSATAVVVQPDGRIIVVGYSGLGATLDGSMVRYNGDGTLDGTFGTGGKVSHLFNGQPFTRATGVVLQADGRIVVVGGSVQPSGSFFYVARFNPDGSLDTRFGTGGRVSTSGLGASSVLLQPDGKIVVAGAGLLRFNTDGSPDATFGTGGQLSTSFAASGVVLQPDGSIVVSGGNFALARYNLNGTLDTTFGNNGLASASFAGTSGAFGLALQPDGRFVVAGTVSPATGSSSMALARFNPNGSLDPTFGTAGTVTTDFGPGNASALGVALQPDGRIVVAGKSPNNGGDFALARYLTDSRIGVGSQRFVSQVYLDLLQRPADSAGLTFWSSSIDQGMSRASVVAGIEASVEYHTLIVKRLYLLVLRRTVDPFGLNGFVTFLNQGGTTSQLESTLLGSDEYFNRRGDGSNNGFLQVLYQDVLRRPIDPTGSGGWNQTLNSGVPRGTVAASILASQEFDMLQVQSLYRQFLRRAPDAVGLPGFTNALQMGATIEQVIAGLVGSDEYFGRL